MAKQTTQKKTLTKKPAVPKKKAKAPIKHASPKPVPAGKTLTLKPGDFAPAFSLPSDSGETVSLKSLRGKVVVLFFYPKDMTPGCTQEACDFRDAGPQIQKRNVIVLGISRDSIESHQKFRVKHNLNFLLLADTDGEVCEAYGVWKEKSMYGRKYMGILRSTFVIGADGKFLRVIPDVKVGGHVDDILSQL